MITNNRTVEDAITRTIHELQTKKPPDKPIEEGQEDMVEDMVDHLLGLGAATEEHTNDE